MSEQPADDYEDGYAEPAWDEADVLQFDAPAPDPAARAPIPFRIGDDPTVLVSYRPKYAVLMRLVRLSDSADQTATLKLVDEFIEVALDPESAEYLRGKFEDPECDWDYDVLIPIITQLTRRWFPKSPAGRSPGSRSTPTRTGRRSTVRSRSEA